VAVVGLGTGTMACWGRAGERWTFYEIDPLIEHIARDARLFTYLRDCPPEAHVELGDARVRLAEAPAGAYDLVLLDAFSSDAIPMHLITREALALYLSRLAPGGLIAFHVSNRYLDLVPVLTELARDARIAGAVGNDVSGLGRGSSMYSSSSWVVLGRRAADVAPMAKAAGWQPLPPRADVRVWTDDYTDVVDVVKWR
jgi:spermidine synthase